MSQATNPNSTSIAANSSLAERIQSYWSAFDAFALNGDDGSENAVQSALRRLNGLPVVTAQDAQTAFDWLIHDGHEPLADCYGSPDNPWPSIRMANEEGKAISALRAVVTTSLIRELFNYITATASGREL